MAAAASSVQFRTAQQGFQPQDILRRTLRAELADIEKKLTSFHQVDDTTRSIEEWRVQFRAALGNAGDAEATRATYLASLQKILQKEPVDSTHPAVSHMRTWLSKQRGEAAQSVDPLAELEQELNALTIGFAGDMAAIVAADGKQTEAFEEGLHTIQATFDERMRALQPQAAAAAAGAAELRVATQTLSQDVASAAKKAHELAAKQKALLKEIEEAAKAAKKKRKKRMIRKVVVAAAAVAVSVTLGVPIAPTSNGAQVSIPF